ncbi:MAG: hypothetical protein LBV69_02095 [Bacteroidales bacterium]|nr:hypothetical protein [Bacteroidales bacterium]
MKEKNKYIYYGIVFLFLYRLIFQTICRLIHLLILYLHWDILVLPITLLVIVLVFSFLFAKIKSFPSISIWCFMLIFAISGFILILNPFSSELYKTVKCSIVNQTEVNLFINAIEELNLFAIVIISFFKYRSIKEPKTDKE